MKDYEIVTNEKGLKAIVNNKKNTIISRWFKDLFIIGLINDSGFCYIGKNNRNQIAIFNTNNKKTPISKWFKEIYYFGLIEKENNCYIGVNKERSKAVFNLKNKEKPVSRWYKNQIPNTILKKYNLA